MKVSILIILVVLPMLASIGLYSYAFISTRWNSINNNLIGQYDLKNKQRGEVPLNNDDTVQLKYQLTRYQFRSRYGLFGYCLDYNWLNLLTIKSSNESKSNSSLTVPPCNQSSIFCPETNLCVKKCTNIPDCPSQIDEEGCIRNYDQTRYYWKEGKCLWHSSLFDIQNLPYWLTSYFKSSRVSYDLKLIRYYIMLIFFLMAPILTFVALLILFCVNCIDRFYSIPFAFVSCLSFASFLSGTSGTGIFLYEWIHERFYQFDETRTFGQIEQSIAALNPWIIHIERLGLAFWILIAAIGINLLTTILSCCFCCGLQSEKSKLRIHINNEKYAIIHTSLYDE